uniref:Uncharacterized protein n=1 Tax=Arundo donax TaxID=35708 RepID=A0A0A9H0S1_ARUDO
MPRKKAQVVMYCPTFS